MGTSSWKEDDVQTLIRFWLTESSQVLADRLGKTRNAVIGMAHRLGLASKGKPTGPRKRRDPTMPRRASPKPPAAKPEPTLPIPLIQATAFQCKAVIDNLKDENGLAMVCGKPIVEGKAFSFCSEHFKRFTTSSNRGYVNVRYQPINKQLQ